MKSHGIWHFFKDDFSRQLLVLVFIFLLLPVATLAANDPLGEPSEEKSEYDFRWLDPDKKIYVLQNRKYRKAESLLVSVLGGVGLSNAYRKQYSATGRISYFFTEQFGVEGFFGVVGNSENNNYRALQQTSPSALPTVREIRSQLGVLGQWAPWYAKINVFNSILYFDWYFSLGFGAVNAELDTNTIAGDPPVFVKDNRMAFFAGTGHQFHIDQKWVARLDFMGAFFRAPILGQTGEKVWISNYSFNLGLGYRF